MHGIAPLIAGCAYLAIATGQGSVVVCEGAGMLTFYSARCIDWSFKLQPLLPLAMTAMHGGMRCRGDRHALGPTHFLARRLWPVRDSRSGRRR